MITPAHVYALIRLPGHTTDGFEVTDSTSLEHIIGLYNLRANKSHYKIVKREWVSQETEILAGGW